MKFDISRLPVLEAVVGFLILSLIATFVVAFTVVDVPDSGVEVLEPTATSDGSATAAPSDGPGGAIAVAMLDNSFDPKEITVAAGASAEFAITNEGAAIHNMRIAGADGEYNTDDDAVSDPDLMRGGQEGTLTWDVPADAGEVDFRCDFHPTDMTGTITIE